MTEKYKSWRKKSMIYMNNSRIIRRLTKSFSYSLLIYWNWLTTDIHSSRVRKQPKNEKSWISYLRTFRQTVVSIYIKQKSRFENCSFVLKIENGSIFWKKCRMRLFYIVGNDLCEVGKMNKLNIIKKRR